jgi:phosphohistidine phosphatase
MTDLYILRHGIAVSVGTPGITDDERPLTTKGEKRMRQIARGLLRLDLNLDRIATSPLPRAKSTAEIVARELGTPELVETCRELGVGASAADIARWLAERTEDRLMIVGHNPSLSDLISLLVLGPGQPSICDLKKGGIAALGAPAASRGRYELNWVAAPRLIRRLAGAGGR